MKNKVQTLARTLMFIRYRNMGTEKKERESICSRLPDLGPNYTKLKILKDMSNERIPLKAISLLIMIQERQTCVSWDLSNNQMYMQVAQNKFKEGRKDNTSCTIMTERNNL